MKSPKTIIKDAASKLVEMRVSQQLDKPRDVLKDVIEQRDKYGVSVREVRLAPGLLLDPNRPVRSEWKRTPYSELRTYTFDYRKGLSVKEQTDVGFGFGDIPDAGGPYKVRHLIRPKLGQIENLSAFDYELARRSVKKDGACYARFEPVPDDFPVCPPLFPRDMPTDFGKAEKIAAKALGKPIEELNFEDVLKYFRTRESPLKVFKV